MHRRHLGLLLLATASVGIGVLNVLRVGAAPPTSAETQTPAPPTPTPAIPDDDLQADDQPDAADSPASVAEQLEAFRQKILRSRGAARADAADAGHLLEASRLPAIPYPYPAPKVWKEFDFQGEPYQINPLVLEFVTSD